MSFAVTISGVVLNKQNVAKIKKEVSGDWSRIGRYVPPTIVSVWMAIFKSQGARFGTWKQPGVWTKLLRARGKHKIYKSLDEVRNTKQNALEDTGLLRMSFNANNKDSKYGFGSKTIFGGSNLTKARTLNDGGQSGPFKFGNQEEYRLEKNLSKTKTGSKPARTPSGRKSRAKKNWNPEYFITRNAMKKAAKTGRTFPIPARRMEPDASHITTSEHQNMTNALQRGIDEFMGKL